jgi:hypothetical protein
MQCAGARQEDTGALADPFGISLPLRRARGRELRGQAAPSSVPGGEWRYAAQA